MKKQTISSADVLVNNAGIFETRSFLEVDEAYLDRFMNTNLKGTFFTTQAIIPQMQKQKGGVVMGEVEGIAQMVYTVAKSNFITGAFLNVDGGIGAGRNMG